MLVDDEKGRSVVETVPTPYIAESTQLDSIKPGTHQADANELVATKAYCGVGSRRQRLGLKLP